METRTSKFKNYIKTHTPVILASTAAAIAGGAVIVTKIRAPKPISEDGVPQELWYEFLAVARRMDEAVAQHKAELKKK